MDIIDVVILKMKNYLKTKSVKSFVHPCERRRKIQLKIYRSKEVKF